MPSGAARASALDALPHCGGSLLAAAKAANAAYRQCFDGNVSLGGLGAGRIAYWLEGCGLQNHTCGVFSLKPSCNNCAVNF